MTSLDGSRAMDVHETFWAETETRLETHVSETETFKILSETRPRRDVAVSETLAETLKLPRLSRVSGASTSRRDVFRNVWWNTLTMKK